MACIPTLCLDNCLHTRTHAHTHFLTAQNENLVAELKNKVMLTKHIAERMNFSNDLNMYKIRGRDISLTGMLLQPGSFL